MTNKEIREKLNQVTSALVKLTIKQSELEDLIVQTQATVNKLKVILKKIKRNPQLKNQVSFKDPTYRSTIE